MDWESQFARRTRLMKRSAVRELLKLTTQPEVISFAGGLPDPALFPLDRVREAAEAVLVRQGKKALQYGETEGLTELRGWIAERFSSAEARLTQENVLIVSGAQQALDLVGRVMLDPGDRVLVENPTYLALLSAWRPLGVEFLPVSSDSEGLQVEALEPLLLRRPKLLYTIPNFQNPQGTTLALDRRHQLMQLLAGREVGVMEDNPYGQLRYEGPELPHLLTLELRASPVSHCRVLHAGSFSKVLMPGLRVGWIVGPEKVINKLVQAKQATDLHTSTFNQCVVWELLRNGFLDSHASFLSQQYRLRRDAMLTALQEFVPPGITWTRPSGGMFLMVTLPLEVDGQELLRRALRQRVAFVPGEEFHLEGAGRNTVRLNFTHASPERIREGIRRLGALFSEAAESARRSLGCI
jgi:2-aminoadipate transaminase